MEKTIDICGRAVPFKATGATVRIYRQLFTRDLLVDIKALNEARSKKENLSAEALITIENIAYCMARQADPENVPDTPDEWLDGFNMFSIYTVLPQLVDLWQLNELTTAVSKKK